MSSTAILGQFSTIRIASGAGSAKTISAIALGNPTIVTSTAHGLSKGDNGIFASVGGTVTLNGVTTSVIYKTTNTFAVPIDTTSGSAWTSGGTFTTNAFVTLGNVKDFTGLDGTGAEIDISNLQSTGKEFLIGLYDGGQLSMNVDIDNADAGQVAARASQQASTVKAFTITLPDAKVVSFNAYVKQFSMTGGVDKSLAGSMVLRITGGYTLA